MPQCRGKWLPQSFGIQGYKCCRFGSPTQQPNMNTMWTSVAQDWCRYNAGDTVKTFEVHWSTWQGFKSTHLTIFKIFIHWLQPVEMRTSVWVAMIMYCTHSSIWTIRLRVKHDTLNTTQIQANPTWKCVYVLLHAKFLCKSCFPSCPLRMHSAAPHSWLLHHLRCHEHVA